MPYNPGRHYYSSAAATRPAVLPEEEAEVCELSVSQVRGLREKLEQSEPGPSRQRAMNDCVKWLSVPISEAATIIKVPLKSMMSAAHHHTDGTFQHKGRWRMWIVAVRDTEQQVRASRG
jgi:hypothetical protein